MIRFLSVCAIATAALLTGASSSSAAKAPAAKGHSCNPPGGTFYYAVEVEGVRCKQARRVLTKGTCDNHKCSRFSYGKWHCKVKGGIAQRMTRCERAGTDRTIVGRASGD